MFSFFTAKQANEALPDVIKKFEYALAKKNDITKIEKELQMTISTTNSFEKYMILKQQLNSAITKFYQSVEILESTGVMIKSIEQGLLDFPSKRFMKRFVFVGNMVKLKSNFGMIKILALWEGNLLKLVMKV